MDKRLLKPKVASKYIFNGNYTHKGLQILGATAGLINRLEMQNDWIFIYVFFFYISIVITKLM